MTPIDRDRATSLNESIIVTNPFVWPEMIQVEPIISFAKAVEEFGINQIHMHPLHVMQELNVPWGTSRTPRISLGDNYILKVQLLSGSFPTVWRAY